MLISWQCNLTPTVHTGYATQTAVHPPTHNTHPVTSTLWHFLSSSNTVSTSSTVGFVVLTTAQAVALLIFSSHPPTNPTISPKGLMPSSRSPPRLILPELVGRNPPGFRVRGMGDIRRDSVGRNVVIDARRVWVGVVSWRWGDAEVEVGEVYWGDTTRREGVRLGWVGVWGVCISGFWNSEIVVVDRLNGTIGVSLAGLIDWGCADSDCCHCRRSCESILLVGRGAWIAWVGFVVCVGEGGGWSVACEGSCGTNDGVGAGVELRSIVVAMTSCDSLSFPKGE